MLRWRPWSKDQQSGHVNVLREEEAQLKEKSGESTQESRKWTGRGPAKTELAALRKIGDSMGTEMNKHEGKRHCSGRPL